MLACYWVGDQDLGLLWWTNDDWRLKGKTRKQLICATVSPLLCDVKTILALTASFLSSMSGLGATTGHGLTFIRVFVLGFVARALSSCS